VAFSHLCVACSVQSDHWVWGRVTGHAAAGSARAGVPSWTFTVGTIARSTATGPAAWE